MTSIVSTEHLEELRGAIHALTINDVPSALEILQGILAKDPSVPEALHILGLCSVLLNDLGRGIQLISEAHELDGECREYADALASLKAQAGDLNSSLYFAKLATTLEPHPELANLNPASLEDYAGSLANVKESLYHLDAMLQYSRRHFAEAVDLCEKELRINPTSFKALLTLGKSLYEIGEHSRATIAFHAAEQIEPGTPEVATELARCMVMLGKNDDAIACFTYAQEQAEYDEDAVAACTAHIQALSVMDSAHWQSRTDIEDVALARAKTMGIEKSEESDVAPAGKIRIGILSNSLYHSDEALILESFLEHYDRKRFEVFCLQQSITHDKMTERLKSLCDFWRPVFDLDDWVLASIISGDGIQALIDLSQNGPGQRRPTLIANPAPIQVSWLNHLDGTGKGIINLILADAVTVETDRRTALDGQEIAELETGLFAFSEFSMMQDVTPLPAIEQGNITFGAFADLSRVNAHTAKNWSLILKAVPNSLLVLNVMPNLPDDVRAELSAHFAHYGMSKRVVFLSNTPTTEEPEQEFLADVDILLDAAINTSAAQVARALWMGLPVLTLSGERRNNLIAASVLTSAGKSEWVAKTAQDLAKTAQTLAEDYDALAKIRLSLREDIRGSVLFQGRDLAREIETSIEIALEDMDLV